jgi:hypothetical protein
MSNQHVRRPGGDPVPTDYLAARKAPPGPEDDGAQAPPWVSGIDYLNRLWPQPALQRRHVADSPCTATTDPLASPGRPPSMHHLPR